VHPVIRRKRKREEGEVKAAKLSFLLSSWDLSLRSMERIGFLASLGLKEVFSPFFEYIYFTLLHFTSN